MQPELYLLVKFNFPSQDQDYPNEGVDASRGAGGEKAPANIFVGFPRFGDQQGLTLRRHYPAVSATAVYGSSLLAGHRCR